MFEPGTNQRLVYFQFDLRFTILIMFGQALRRYECRTWPTLLLERVCKHKTKTHVLVLAHAFVRARYQLPGTTVHARGIYVPHG